MKPQGLIDSDPGLCYILLAYYRQEARWTGEAVSKGFPLLLCFDSIN